MTYIFFWEEELSESISRKNYFRYFVTYLRLSHYGTPVSDSLHNFGQMTPYLPIDVVFCCIGQIKSHLNFFYYHWNQWLPLQVIYNYWLIRKSAIQTAFIFSLDTKLSLLHIYQSNLKCFQWFYISDNISF